MAIWKRKKKKQGSEENPQEAEIVGTSSESTSSITGGSEGTIQTIEVKEVPGDTGTSETAKENIPIQETEHKQEESVSEKMPELETPEKVQNGTSSGVILFDKKISGSMSKGFWGMLSIAVLPPLFIFAFGIITIVFMLIFPLLGITLIASVPVVLVTLFIFLIAVPILFPFLIVFLLITGKGRLLIGSEGKWIGIEMFGKSYSLK